MKPDLDVLSMACAQMGQQIMRHIWAASRLQDRPHLKKTTERLLNNNLYAYGIKYFPDTWTEAVDTKSES